MTEDRWLAGALGCVAPPAMAVFREPEGVRQGVITPVTGADTRFRARALRMNSRVNPGGGRDDFARGQTADSRDLFGVTGARVEAQRGLGRVLLLVFPRRHGVHRQERVRRADVQAETRGGGLAQAALVFDGDAAIAWCEFGSPVELPRIYHRKGTRAMFEKAGFTFERHIGKSKTVMRKTIPPARG